LCYSWIYWIAHVAIRIFLVSPDAIVPWLVLYLEVARLWHVLNSYVDRSLDPLHFSRIVEDMIALWKKTSAPDVPLITDTAAMFTTQADTPLENRVWNTSTIPILAAYDQLHECATKFIEMAGTLRLVNVLSDNLDYPLPGSDIVLFRPFPRWRWQNGYVRVNARYSIVVFRSTVRNEEMKNEV
jgi:hypothetical protein